MRQLPVGLLTTHLAPVLGQRLRTLRLAKPLRLIDLAAASGVDVATISRIERGKTTGTLTCQFRLTQALGLPLAALYADLERRLAERSRDIPPAQAVAIACPAPSAHRDVPCVRQPPTRRVASGRSS